ncbi:rod shape-determining protein RodA [Candidatus Berkelbacteria bacterium CG08_land_8_20_14_0_20_39_8]|uniref:Rod shape-determining protein RodA n=1 Tax=Candidatus Berkelbacteria bacterium CG08_land_8_20_14_0_20_39_8 TaxID=1974511 RepID=A0A2M6YCC5_9BACT|nr:MAG: rod shape-determining protein RodA [Candidatus Berkelbacteria bacterium CG08_land_8_20_14_0_20_39_8]
MFSKLRSLDLPLLIVSILLAFTGIAVIYSLVFTEIESNLALKQLVFFLIGLLIVFILANFDYRILSGTSWYLYLGVIALLIVVDLFGKTTGGATRWIDLKVFQLQPSEFYKFVSVIFMSSFLSRRIGRIRAIDILYMTIMVIPPLFLILVEPDLGTALVIIFSWFALIFFTRLSAKQYIFIFTTLAIILSVFFLSVYKIKPFAPLLKDYQRSRIETFINPSKDLYGKGYNVAQAQIAIGSGGIFGHGLSRGSQSQLKFLPKPETDFIFSGYSEAFGLIGDLLLFAALIYLLIRTVDIAKTAKDNFGYLLAVGTGATFGFQIIINIAMNLGLAPVTGIPLPFISAGGSSLITSFVLIGILESIYIHRKKISF